MPEAKKVATFDVLARIRALVLRAASENEHEARTSAVIACRLIREHGVHLSLDAPPPPPPPPPAASPYQPFGDFEELFRQKGRTAESFEDWLRRARATTEDAARERAARELVCGILGHEWRRESAYLARCSRCGRTKG